MTLKLGALRFAATPSSGVILPNASTNLMVDYDPAGDLASPDQRGMLLLYTDNRKGREADIVTITP